MEVVLSWGGPEESRWGCILGAVLFSPRLATSGLSQATEKLPL